MKIGEFILIAGILISCALAIYVIIKGTKSLLTYYDNHEGSK